MKILIVLFITICALPFFLFSGDSCKPLPYDKIVDDLIKKTSLKLEKKHQLQLVGVKEGMMA